MADKHKTKAEIAAEKAKAKETAETAAAVNKPESAAEGFNLGGSEASPEAISGSPEAASGSPEADTYNCDGCGGELIRGVNRCNGCGRALNWAGIT